MMAACKIRHAILAVGMVISLAAGAVDYDRAAQDRSGFDDELYYGFGINLRGAPAEVMRFKHWLDEIARVPKGVETLWAISRSRHHLTIEHSRFAVLSSGRTQAPMTMNLTNGVGEDVVIKFNAYIPEQGSHRVFDARERPIEFNALQNLYHELAHAMHKMTGTWLYFRSEQSAIEEENVFRRELAELENRPYHKRWQIDGEAVCPASRMELVAWAGQELICKFN